mgnify:CR=1 FL=1
MLPPPFPKSLTIDACEQFLLKLDKANGGALLLPVGASSYAFGGLAAAIQAVNTWARKSGPRTLEFRHSEKGDDIEELLGKPHKFSAAMSAKHIAYSDAPINDLRPVVYTAAKAAIEAQARSNFGQQHGHLCWFAFVDHSSKGFDKNFYIDGPTMKPEPRQPAQFQAVIQAMIEKSLLVSGGAKALDRDNLDHLGRIFYELFLNTHEHGTRGATRSEWLRPGVRVIYTQGINLSAKGTEGFIKRQPVLSDYIKNLPGSAGQRRFVEISIVDSGLGYSGRWLADHHGDSSLTLPIEDEYRTFKQCFSFRQTSTSQDNKGNGLPVVMDRLTRLSAFMRIRSGRLSLYRDFVAAPYETNNTCTFSDWSTGELAEENLTSMSPVAGVAITLLIPMEAKQ